MKSPAPQPASIDEYIAGYPPEVQTILRKIRKTIREAIPDAQEAIKYRIPTFVSTENLVHFAAFKSHIGFFPTSSGIREFKDQISSYKWAKGSVQFPLARPIPYELIKKIARFRATQARENHAPPSKTGNKRRQDKKMRTRK